MTNVKVQGNNVAHLVTKLPGPKAAAILERDARSISSSYTRSYPFVAASGRGALVEDVDGNTFVDFAAGIAVVSTGHCHPDVVAAIQKQAAELIHMSGTDFYYPNMVELAEKLGAVTPGKKQKRVYYGNSGTEAIEAAIKLARYHTRREKFIAFYGGFHGRTMGALSLTASKAVQRKGFGSLLSGVFHAPYPDPYRCPHGTGVAGGSYCGECGSFIERELFHKLVAPEDVAGIVIEPIQGEGGYLPAPAEFLRYLQSLCRKHGILLISDEVQCGMGRTGKWWAGDHAGIEPDILCVAKGIASGMPLSATIASSDIMNWPPGAHASTFGGNLISVAAALETIRLIESQYMDNARRMGDHILGRIAEWPQRHAIVGTVRGVGLMIGVEIVLDRKTKERAHDLRDAIVERAFHKGLLLLGAGENTIRLSPPLMIDREQADFAVDTLDSCIAEAAKAIGK
ncbi:MAG: acetyl ornithine aminotransferase family protein [Candidatus Acidiferrales bacterium]